MDYTNGKWEVNGNKVQISPEDPMNTITICQTFGNVSLPENAANIRLIAEAPNMLELLEAISNGNAFDKDTGLIWSHWLQMIDETIKRVGK